MLSADGVPAIYAFLPETGRVITRTDRRDFDLAIVLDAGDLTRVGVSAEAVQSAPSLMDIDHHVTAGQFGDVRLLDATAAATGEIVYDLLFALGVPLTLPIAECLLCALLTDTGSFRFMNVTPRTMEIAAEMLRIGASPNTIAEHVFENKPFAAQKLLGRASTRSSARPTGGSSGRTSRRPTSPPSTPPTRRPRGSSTPCAPCRARRCALFLREMPSGRLRVSLRSREPVDVSQIAQAFGGGGHRLASGCTLDGPLADAEARLVAEVQRWMASSS
jgi:phosphoesterase RecJ-like protein